jgi:hypothetical protein
MKRILDIAHYNLKVGGWSILPGWTTRDGYATKGTGPRHTKGGFFMTDVVTNNPKSIKNGCARIVKNLALPNKYGREVIAYLGGDIKDGPRPTDLTCIGTLTLDLERGVFLMVNDNGLTCVFDPSKLPDTLCVAFNEKCEVFV